MIKDLSDSLDKVIWHVSELSDERLQEISDVIERALVHCLVEQNMRAPGVSASLLTT